MIKTMHCSAAILDNDLCFLLVLYRLGEMLFTRVVQIRRMGGGRGEFKKMICPNICS